MTNQKQKARREWTLRIHSNNDGGGYIYSGSDVEHSKDDYMEVVEKSALQEAERKLEVAKAALRHYAKPGIHERWRAEEALAQIEGQESEEVDRDGAEEDFYNNYSAGEDR